MKRNDIVKDLNKLLDVYSFSDYCPNGLQVEGSEEVNKIAFAVSATKDSIEKAVELGAQMLIVHHGLFWKFHGTRPITKAFAKRVKPLIKNDINLLGYHLPLDAHLVVGNAKALADKIGLSNLKEFGNHKGMPTGVWGKLKKTTAKELAKKIEDICGRNVLTSSPSEDKVIESMGIITGGANGDWVESYKLGLDSYLTGEMSEHDWHEAKESDICMFAAGHHATEKFGIQNLMEYTSNKFKVECVYIDSANPA